MKFFVNFADYLKISITKLFTVSENISLLNVNICVMRIITMSARPARIIGL